MKTTLALAVFLLLSSVANSADNLTLDRCESMFRRGLTEMKRNHFDRMSPACQREVNLGERNESKIRRACTMSELQDAIAMKTIAYNQLAPLCKDASCTSLKARGVCMEGKPFRYYLGKFGL